MLIDWFTVGAQALNFLILVWLFQRFLYKPILNAIDAREKRIAGELADAATKKTEAQRERDEFQNKNKAFDEQRAALLGKATEDAKADRERLIGEARQEAENLRAGQATALRNDQARLANEITRLAKDEVFAIARKTLADLATASLEERLGAVFLRRLREMDGKAKETMAAALKTSSEPAILKSTFDLPAEQKAVIQNALNETFSAEVRLRFATAPDAICGIELTANGQKLAWSIADYLKSLDRAVVGLLAVPSTTAAAPPKTAIEAPKANAENIPVPTATPAAEPVLVGAK
jgi:F-type H+-transporting ATPase subunit b